MDWCVGDSLRSLIKGYVHLQKQLSQLNVKYFGIPRNKSKSFRVVSYNIHFFLDPYSEKKVDGELVKVIENLDGDVLVLQEFNDIREEETQIHFSNSLKNLGFLYESVPPPSDNMFVLKIFSKFPIKQSYYHQLVSSDRHFVEALIELPNNTDLLLYGVHLDVYDDTEVTRSKEIKQILNHASKKPNPHLILGDFNSLRKEDYQPLIWNKIVEHDNLRDVKTKTMVISELQKNGYVDSFVKKGLHVPECTTWNRRRIDYLFLSKNWNMNILDCRVYHDATSDHIPVVCDFSLND